MSVILWTKAPEATLIEKLRDMPALWDPRHELYAKKTAKKELLEGSGRLHYGITSRPPTESKHVATVNGGSF